MNERGFEMKIILLNGPPGAGKDTAAEFICEQFCFNSNHIKFSQYLKSAVHALFGFKNVNHDHFEARKNDPVDELGGKTPRQEYIAMAEDFVKQRYSETFFAENVARVIMLDQEHESEEQIYVISDLGFQKELDYFLSLFDEEDLIVFRLHREGKDFSKDSREYVKYDKAIDIQNNGSYEDLEKALWEELRVCNLYGAKQC